ncbi:MAG: carbon storage regulator [Oscillospiraceae bacterium]
MLLLSRKLNEAIVINGNIEIVITEISSDRVKIGVNAPREIEIVRRELIETGEENKKAVAVLQLPSEFIESFK